MHRFPSWRGSRIGVLAGALLAACGEGPVQGSSDTPSLVAAIAGNDQVGPAMYVLEDSLVVRVTNGDGVPQPGVIVSWAVDNRQAVVWPATTRTDADGIARTAWQLGVDEGDHLAVATVANLPAARFGATSRSAEVREAGGSATVQCGRYGDDIVRCWQPPALGGGRPVALDTDLRFQVLAYAAGEWCGVTRDRLFACVHAQDLEVQGTFRPDAAVVRVEASGMPDLTRLVGGGALEEPTTWCGLTALGAVYCWGDNRAGQAGVGVIGGIVAAPGSAIPSLEATAIAVGGRAVCALTPLRTARCWGDASGSAVAAPVGSTAVAEPVAVPTAQRFISLAGVPGGSFCAVSELLQAWCWGSGTEGGLGRNAVSATTIPVAVEGTEVYVAVTSGGDGFLALTVDRDLVVWGGLSPVRTNAAPFRILRGYVFAGILPGGGDGAVCLRYGLGGGTRCLDRRTAVAGPDDPPPMHGIPEG